MFTTMRAPAGAFLAFSTRGPSAGSAPRLRRDGMHFAQPAGGHVEDEAADLVAVKQGVSQRM
jgi:hypothetical protein